VIRELRAKRVWFATPLLSSAESEIKKVIEEVRSWAEWLGKPVHAWVSDKQGAFVKMIGEVFPGVPHRYCKNHFMRDVAKPVVEADSSAKVQLRRKVRGLRTIEREILQAETPEKKKKL
jgi:transposase-like protein